MYKFVLLREFIVRIAHVTPTCPRLGPTETLNIFSYCLNVYQFYLKDCEFQLFVY